MPLSALYQNQGSKNIQLMRIAIINKLLLLATNSLKTHQENINTYKPCTLHSQIKLPFSFIFSTGLPGRHIPPETKIPGTLRCTACQRDECVSKVVIKLNKKPGGLLNEHEENMSGKYSVDLLVQCLENEKHILPNGVFSWWFARVKSKKSP